MIREKKNVSIMLCTTRFSVDFFIQQDLTPQRSVVFRVLVPPLGADVQPYMGCGRSWEQQKEIAYPRATTLNQTAF